MRIIAGVWRGRTIVAPKGHGTRPTSDRAREALFSSLASLLGPELGAVTVLEPFAGSGALGLEALSRGAPEAVFIEQDPGALTALRDNIDALGAGDRAKVVAGDAFRLGAAKALPGGPFGLILADPPYRIDAARMEAFFADLVAARSLEEGAVVVYEHSKGVQPGWPGGIEGLRTRRYGIAEISYAVYSEELQ